MKETLKSSAMIHLFCISKVKILRYLSVLPFHVFHVLFPSVKKGDTQGNNHNPYWISARFLKRVNTYTRSMTHRMNMPKGGTINFHSFVSGYFQGRKEKMTAIDSRNKAIAPTPMIGVPLAIQKKPKGRIQTTPAIVKKNQPHRIHFVFISLSQHVNIIHAVRSA